MESDKKQLLYPSAKSIARLLELMSLEDLHQLYIDVGINDPLASSAKKDFIIKRISEKADKERLLRNRSFVLRMLEHHKMLLSGLEKILSEFDIDTLSKIYKELKNEDIDKNEKKPRIIQKLLVDVPFEKIWKSKSLRNKTTSRKPPKTDLKKMNKEIFSHYQDLRNIEKKYQESNAESFNEIKNKMQIAVKELQHLSEQQQKLLQLLSMQGSPTLFTFLENFRKELIAFEDMPSPEKLCELVENVKNRLQVDDFSFTSRGLEVMFAYYLSKEIREMGWAFNFQEFLSVVREEIPKIEIIPNQAEIPELRERVTRRLGISDAIFDKQLVKAWQEGYVSLHSGAPRGRSEVKYLEYEDNKYFYTSLRWK